MQSSSEQPLAYYLRQSLSRSLIRDGDMRPRFRVDVKKGMGKGGRDSEKRGGVTRRA